MIRLLIIFLFISFWSIGQDGLYPHAPNLTTENLKGAVRSVEEKGFIGIEQNGEYVASRPGWQYSWECDTKSTYDPQGNLITVDTYRSGKIERSETYMYKDLKLVESIGWSRNVYEYDRLNRISVAYADRTQPTRSSGWEQSIDKSRSIRTDYFYDVAGNLTLKKTRVYDTINQIVDSVFYDERNRPIKIQSYYNDYVEFQLIEYDSMGNIDRCSKGDNDYGVREKTNYFYESNQLILEDWIQIPINGVFGETISIYENGNVIETIGHGSYEDTVKVIESSYDFDQKGNWIKKTIKSSDDEDVYVITRTIEYY